MPTIVHHKVSPVPATKNVTIQWLKDHRAENNRFLASMGIGIITIAALFALADLASVSLILAWSALALLALALPWTDWVNVWNRPVNEHAWHRREARGHIRPPIG